MRGIILREYDRGDTEGYEKCGGEELGRRLPQPCVVVVVDRELDTSSGASMWMSFHYIPDE